MTKTKYIEEDFKNASFARHPNGWIAARFDDYLEPWCTTDGRWRTDAEMADHGWVPVREAAEQPITLDALHEAWETAEVADERNEGDILILRHPDSPTELVEVWRSPTTGPMPLYVRIFRRASKPKREPWQDLADVLRAHTGEPDPDGTAKMLHEHGVRMTEEGDK